MSAEPAPAPADRTAPLRPTVVSELVEEQVIEGEARVRALKQLVRFGEEAPLFAVRKHLPDGPTRPPVLLLHGFAQNRYAQGFDVWNLELRGHGRSRDEGTSGAETFADYVSDVSRVVAALPDRPFLIGHSLGGAVSYATGATLPEGALRGVVGIGALYQFGQANWAIHALGALTHSLRDAPWMAQLQVRTRIAGRLLAKLYGVSDVAGWAFPISGWWPGSIEPDILHERLVKGFDWTSVKVWMEMSRWAATGHFEYDEGWSRRDVPVLVLLGDEDHLMPPADGRSAYERSGSQDRSLHILDDWHHEVHWGHLDLVLGRLASKHVWPLYTDWMIDRCP
jgi:pimeloyl-ACP methyl ester carboxylesterase